MRKILLLVSILLITVLFTISSSAKILTLASDPIGSSTYAGSAGIANIINQYNTIGLNIKVKPTNGAMDVAGLLATGEAQIGVHNSFDSQSSWLTKGDFQFNDQIIKVIPLRLLWARPTFSSALTHMKTGIKTGADLKGKRFVGEYTGSPQDTAQGIAFLAGWGLTKEDVIWMKVPDLSGGIRTLIEGTADAVAAAGPTSASTKELEATKGARFLSLNNTPEGLEAFRKSYPWEVTTFEVEPNPNLSGIVETTTMINFEDYYMGRADQINDDEAYAIVETIWNHIDEIKALGGILSLLTKPELLAQSNNTVPFHPGAIKFYKEKGLWNQAFEDRNNLLLALEAEEMKE